MIRLSGGVGLFLGLIHDKLVAQSGCAHWVSLMGEHCISTILALTGVRPFVFCSRWTRDTVDAPKQSPRTFLLSFGSIFGHDAFCSTVFMAIHPLWFILQVSLRRISQDSCQVVNADHKLLFLWRISAGVLCGRSRLRC